MLSRKTTFRTDPLDIDHINEIRAYFINRYGSYINLSSAVRFALSEVAHLINNGHKFERHAYI